MHGEKARKQQYHVSTYFVVQKVAQVFYRTVSLKRVAGHLQAKKGIRDTGLVTEQD